MRAMFFALSADDVGELLPSVVEVIVNYSVFELAGVRQLLARVLHAALDDVLGILPAGAHAPLQLLDRRRQDEDADRVGIELAHLLRALPVDFEDQVVAALQRIEDHLLRSAVAVAVHLGALEKLAAAAHGEERRVVDEMVVDAVLLARARRSRGVRDGELEARVFPHQRVDQRRLARPRRRGDDEQKPAHSMFCTCSRICSTRSLSSSAQSDSGWLAAFEASVLASRLSSWAMKSSRLPTAPPRSRAATSWSSAAWHSRWAITRSVSSSPSGSATTPGHRNTSATRNGAASGKVFCASAARLLNRAIASAFKRCGRCGTSLSFRNTRQSILPRATRARIRSRSPGSSERSSSATRNCRSRKRAFTERNSRLSVPRGESAAAAAYPVMLRIISLS